MADYSRLSKLIGTHQDLAIFRKFASLNAKNILYMQAELIHLQTELENIELANRNSGDVQKAAFQVSLFDLKDSFGTKNDLQWRKAMEIRRNLKAYNDALLQYTKLQEFEAPSHRPVEVLKGWLDRPEGGDFFLRGREAEIWDEDKDLIAVAPSQDRGDSLIWLISDKIVPWYHRRWGHRKKHKASASPEWNGVWHYEEEGLVILANSVSTVLASLLPTASILVLYFVEKPLARLALTMLFNAVFSLTLATITKARRIDVFAATTAFAAVQVVFLGGSNVGIS